MMEDSTTLVDKQTSTVTTLKKRAKLANLGSNLTPPKKSKRGIASDDLSLSNGSQSKEAGNVAVGQTFEEDENLSTGEKKNGEKIVKDKVFLGTYTRKTGRLSTDSKGLKTSPQDADDSIDTSTPSSVKGKHGISASPIPVVIGLLCSSVMNSPSKKSKQLTSENPQNAVEPETPQSGVPLSPKTTGNQMKGTSGETVIKRKRGRPFKNKNLKTSVAVNQQNGVDLTLQQEKNDKPVTGKRGERHMITLNVTASPQDIQDSPAQENGNCEINAEKSLVPVPVSEEQPLSRWLVKKHSLTTPKSAGGIPTNGDGQPLTFEKRSSLWKMLESTEAFRQIPQKPHFGPLANVKESARERHAINKMVDFSAVFEETQNLRIDHPRAELEELLETLSELETHGFDVGLLRDRLTNFISVKDKWEGLERRSKDIKGNIEKQRVNVQVLNKQIESIDQQVSHLLNTRDRLLKDRVKKDSEIAAAETEAAEIEASMNDILIQIPEKSFL